MQRKHKVKREQPRKDSRDKRVNFDNTRESKFKRDMEREAMDAKPDTSKCNDVSWYAANPELLRSAASIPFSPVPGLKVPGLSQQSVPGIMTLTWNPAITAGANAPLNQAANSMYSFTVHANSRNQSYDAVDEMLLVLAGAQVFSALALGIRAYGLMRRYSQQDYYTPLAMLQASGFDSADLQLNYSKMWFDLNELIARTQQIWIPNTMPVIARWFWMNSNVYKDAESAKAQYYMFVPAVFYKYDETTETTGGSLQPVAWYSPNLNDASIPKKWSQYVSMVNDLINALINSQDRGIIFGDILKAYGAEKLYAIKDLPVDYRLEPVYDREVLTQIENATVWPGMYSSSTGVGPIVQSSSVDYLTQKWSQSVLEAGGPNLPFDAPEIQVLNFHQLEVPTPAQVMVATRLKCAGAMIYNQVTASTWNIGPVTAGTEVVINVSAWNYLWTDGVPALRHNTITQGVTALPLFDVYMWSAFDWCPWIYQFTTNNKPTTNLKPGLEIAASWYDSFGDWDNYTFITMEELKKMNLTAIYSEFGVPVLM